MGYIAGCASTREWAPSLDKLHLATAHKLGLAYSRETWAYPLNTVLATVAFLLILDKNLLSQAGITHYSQLHETTEPY